MRTRYRPGAPRLIEVGFRQADPAEAGALELALAEQERLRGGPADLGWESAHGAEFERLADESTYATGDGNLVELLATVRIRVADPAAYFWGAADPDAAVRAAAEARCASASPPPASPRCSPAAAPASSARAPPPCGRGSPVRSAWK